VSGAKPNQTTTGRQETRRGALYIGAISGTSLDGLDLALVDIGAGHLQTLAGTTVPFSPELQQALRRLALGDDDDVDTLGYLDSRLGTMIGTAIQQFLDEQGLPTERIRAIGSHGQTVRHRPDGSAPFSLQIGDPNRIVEMTGIATVADFRRRDMAAGGQGAPLVPLFHQALVAAGADSGLERWRDVLVNIGGIANLSLLPQDSHAEPAGFDSGPGNALLDAWIQHHRQVLYDADGAWSASGSVDRQLLQRLLADPYFQRPAPKSTGKEYFNLAWLEQHLKALPAPPAAADVQATLVELTARTICDAAREAGSRDGRMILCGGGRLNQHLKDRLAALSPGHKVMVTEDLGIQGDWVEAAAFAWLAHRHLAGLPGNAAAVTGAKGPRVLGGLYLP
jgi:anhydro-N-acetylmuramic acid kinase